MGAEKARLYVCAARIELTIPGALTLKDRRAVVRSLTERLRGRFNLAVADLDGGGRGAGRAALGLAAASNEREHANETIDKVLEFIADDTRVETGDVQLTEV